MNVAPTDPEETVPVDDDHDDWFEDYCDDWDQYPVKEEPDCYSCNDNGCRDCNPTRLQWWWFRTKWAVINRARRLRPASRRADDESPF